ncbi:MAG: NAD-dependent epimerase/dehydratase family protein [Rhodospirillaceae bacterium]|nr:NAD-dependent epimerase/dehydratase family protein [Rhodospirillaceae bacterium]MBT6137645.1 NAD-dependent epimerase/dehydratase family protein [Rhodospirillaceae bacterium]
MRDYKRILVTGGAGFVGSNLALAFKRDLPNIAVVSLDNLHRRGSELSLDRLKAAGVEFLRGDVRSPDDFAAAGSFDLLLDCSAEPSVHAGYDSGPSYLVDTNLTGTTHCLEAARRTGADLLFLSTSRVYPIKRLAALPLVEHGDRFVIEPGSSGPGWSDAGITVDFPLTGTRSLYGATKLASELLIQEYAEMYGVRAVIDRCGVLTGPWQMGKVDQGFLVLWAARHLYGGPLAYMGFGGTGKQVRDILHVTDLYRLLRCQLERIDDVSGHIFNVGGGAETSVSLTELSALCREISGNSIDIASDPETRPADIPYYVTDNSEVSEMFDWAPEYGVEAILEDVHSWLVGNREMLAPILGPVT